MKTFLDYGINVRSKHGRHYTLCPQCSSNRTVLNKDKPCLSVYITNLYPEAGYWKCHHCGWTGGIKEPEGFVHEYTKPVWNKPERVIPSGALEIKPGDISGLPVKVIEHFRSRGIPERILAGFEIDYTDEHFFPDVKGKLPAILFPYFVGEEVIDIKYRGRTKGRKTFARVTGAEQVPYNINSLRIDKPLVWVEGEMDVLSVASLPENWACVSPPLGAPQPKDKSVEGKFRFWESFSDLFLSVQKHIIAVDRDAPGRRLAEELIKRLGPERCYTVEFPEDCKDVNEVLVKYGAEALSNLLQESVALPISGLVEAISLADKVFDLYEYGACAGEPTGWQSVTDLYTVKKKQLTIVTGIPSHGKSNWLDALLVNLAKGSGWKFLLFSPEMVATERHIGQLASKYTGKPFLERFPGRMNHEELANAIVWINEHFYFLDLEDENAQLDTILDKVKAQISRTGLDGLVIDPWNEIDHARLAHLSETEYISVVLGKLKKFARKYDIHIWLVAHPRIMPAEKDAQGNTYYGVPTPYHISGSANWRNKADNCISIWRDQSKQDFITQVHIQKVKLPEIGDVGMTELWFDLPTGRYFEKYYSQPRPEVVVQEELTM